MDQEQKDKIYEIIKNNFIKHKEIISVYVYGSILTDRYIPGKSDVDILIITNDLNRPDIFLKKIRENVNSLKSIKTDINIVFLSEFKKRMHIYRPPTYFWGIKNEGELIFGKDLLSQVHESEITPKLIYKRAIDLAQGARGVYINSKDSDFWRKKYVKWLRVLALEVLYLHGIFDLYFESGLVKLIKINKSFEYLEHLLKKRLPMNTISNISERLKTYIFANFIKNAK